jgi:hypothetical protein
LSTKIFRQNASTKILSTKCFSTKVSLDERHRIRTYIVVKSRKNGQFTDEKNSKQLYNAFRSLTIINNDTFERCSCWLSSLISTLPIYLIVRFD